MTGRFLILRGLAMLMIAGISGAASAQTSLPYDQRQNTQMQNSQSPPSRSQAPRQTAQATGFDPWHARGHDLDNVADKLNACMLHPPEDRQRCIDEALEHPE